MNKKFMRGQVWLREDPEYKDPTSRIQDGFRPVVIFSSDYGNKSSNLVNVIPLTAEYKPDLAINIVFYLGSRRNTALCNQLYPIDKHKLIKLIGIVPSSVMDNIEIGVLTANQMTRYISQSQQDNQMSKLFNQFKNLVDTMIDIKLNEFKSTLYNPEQDIKELQSNMNNIIKSGISSGQSVHNNNNIEKIVDTDNTELSGSVMIDALNKAKVYESVREDNPTINESNNKLNSSPRERERKKSSSKRSQWDIEKCKQYLKDRDTMKAKDIMKKYDLSDIKRVYMYSSYCRTKLNKAGVNYDR